MGEAKAMSRCESALREAALGYPEAREEFPWGERVVKVRGKVFVFLGKSEDGSLGLSCKLPDSHHAALLLPFAEPTGYGLGKSGWVSARFAADEEPPLGLLLEWLDESYRAVAPKRLVAQVEASGAPSGSDGGGPSASPATAKSKPAATATAKSKPAATAKSKPAATAKPKPAATASGAPQSRRGGR